MVLRLKQFLILFACSVFIYEQAFSQSNHVENLLIPIPTTVVDGSGYFAINNETKVISKDQDPNVMRVVDFLTNKLGTTLGRLIKSSVSNASPSNAIILGLTKDNSLGDEGYTLRSDGKNVTILANKPAGLFYGVQTLYQLMPKEIEARKKVEGINWKVPNCQITDVPRFGWRGLMLDVSRHFFSKEEVKGFIDEMVKYKFNMFHWHLTDDQGWRIEIKGYPKLTSKGAWNVKKEGYFGTFTPPSADEARNYGGYYTQEDIREVVQYAKDRFVNILPEIDVPGHSLAAVSAYPQLSCTSEADTYQVNSGESFMDWSHGAPPIALQDNTMCPANDFVYKFLDDVFTQVAQLFPFAYIHTGGDEAPHNYWEKQPQILDLMKKENLKTPDEVQSYFTRKIEKIVSSKGKKLIGWDEILQGGLAPNAAVMSWRGVDGGIQAAKMGHEVVMSPTTFAYLDYMQGDPAIESKVYATLTLQKAYEFDPLPQGVDIKFIKGGQANLWAEQIYNTSYMQYMLWPRALATAEATWSLPKNRSWKSFQARVQVQLPRLSDASVRYAPSLFEPLIKVTWGDNPTKIKVYLKSQIDSVDIHYSFDNSFPDNTYSRYTVPLVPPSDAVQLKLVSYKNGKQVGRYIIISMDDLKKRVGQDFPGGI